MALHSKSISFISCQTLHDHKQTSEERNLTTLPYPLRLSVLHNLKATQLTQPSWISHKALWSIYIMQSMRGTLVHSKKAHVVCVTLSRIVKQYYKQRPYTDYDDQYDQVFLHCVVLNKSNVLSCWQFSCPGTSTSTHQAWIYVAEETVSITCEYELPPPLYIHKCRCAMKVYSLLN